MLRALIRVPSWKVRLGIDLGLRPSFTEGLGHAPDTNHP